MSASITTIYGLRGLSLTAFQAAAVLVARNMRRLDPEDVLRSMREHLAAAAQEPTWERGCAQVAIAANKLAVAIRIGDRA